MAERESLTLRFPAGLLAAARTLKLAGESLNDLVVEATEREIRRRQGLQANATILQLRARVRTRTGAHPDPVPLIRALREGGPGLRSAALIPLPGHRQPRLAGNGRVTGAIGP